MKILGIDPGYDRVGIGIIEKNERNELKYIYSTTISTNKKDTFVKRLLQIELELSEIINIYKPNLIVIESLFFAKNVKTAMDVAQARGSILLTCGKYLTPDYTKPTPGKPTLPNREGATQKYNPLLTSPRGGTNTIIELTPMQIKSSLVGDGHSTKDRVEYMVRQILKLTSPRPSPKEREPLKNKTLDDEIDALSIALAGERHSHLH